ncbi:HlyD family type I secretion periplasmic adaptor subunit [Rhodoblastus acidophilus]|nr:HlyD family type I secretion periplasmic adaptor subunit [Rhodoblastus acidophilus]RAI18277.1 HlyD family type I secretion periplasmic adaptor subunit [Rhodoblastus acidophilus]
MTMTAKKLLETVSSWVELGREIVNAKTSAAPEKDGKSLTDWRPIAFAGYTVIGMTFGVAGVWAAVAKLDKAVMASGFVETEMNRKTIQHFEGGIIREILVKEGEHVAQGQPLFRLQRIQAEASRDTVVSQLNSALALEARLLAEREQKESIVWPAELASQKDDPNLPRIMADQAHQFSERRASLGGQIDILEKRVEQLGKQIQGIAIEKDSTQKQVAYINQELVNLRELATKKLVPLTRVFSMERERTRLEGVIGQSDADTAKAESTIGETKLQIQQARQKFQEEVASNLLDTRQKVSELQERKRVAQDVLTRVDIATPRSGTVQNLKVFTIGQVIRSGEPLLDIVPDDEPLIVSAQFSPTDIDIVYAGMQAEIRFPAFHARSIPVMMGELRSLSHDRLMDEMTRQYYFRGVIALNRADIPEDYRARLRSGMPAEVVVAAGERTVLSYIVSPLTGSLRKALREPND